MKGSTKLFLGLTLSCSMILGCAVSVGPQVKTEVVIVHPGNPVLIIENRKLKAQELKSGLIVEIDVGGFIAMPQEHWKAVKKILDEHTQQ